MRTLKLLVCAGLAVWVGCDSTTCPEPALPRAVDSLVAATELPRKQEPTVKWLAYPPGVALFELEYGDPLDCPAGCYYSSAVGLLNREKAGWFTIEDGEYREWSEIDRYELDERDENLYSAQAFEALEACDLWFFHSRFLPRLAVQTSVPSEALILVARSLETYIHDSVARKLIANPAVREDREVLFVLAALPPYNEVYIAVREEARELLGTGGP